MWQTCSLKSTGRVRGCFQNDDFYTFVDISRGCSIQTTLFAWICEYCSVGCCECEGSTASSVT